VTADVSRAAAVLRAGGLVAFPTETVYGLGADAANGDALRRLYTVKGRPAEHPVIVHIPEDAGIDPYARDVPQLARDLAAAFWPGPLTLVLYCRPAAIAPEATGGLDTVGLRVPAEPTALALLREFGDGIAAPSANRFGRVSPTTAAHVRADLGDDVDLVLDGGDCAVGIESTIVDLTSGAPRILRVGGLSAAVLEELVGVEFPVGGGVVAPGTLPTHYAPRARVELVARADLDGRAEELVAAGESVAALAIDLTALDAGVVLPAPRSVDEYARVLYARLREADAAGADVVLVVPPPAEGIGVAVRDRLRRAAAGSVD
jgi:L-threonylcarbamoyladenylate synthase